MHWVAKLKDWKELLSKTSRFGLRQDLPVTMVAQKGKVALQAQDGALCFRFQTPAEVKKPGAVALPLSDLAKTARGRSAELEVVARGTQVTFAYGKTFKLELTAVPEENVVRKLPELKPNVRLTREDLDVILNYMDVGTAHFHGQLVNTLAVEARPLKKGTAFILTDTFSGVMYRSPRQVEWEDRESSSVQIPRTLLNLARYLAGKSTEEVPLMLSTRRVACFGSDGEFFQSPAVELSPVKDMPGTLKSLKTSKPDCRFVVEARELRQALEDLVAAVDKPTTVNVTLTNKAMRLGVVGGQVQAQATVPLLKAKLPAKGLYKFTGAVLVMLAVVRPWDSALTFQIYDRRLVWVTGEEPHVDYLIPTAT